MRRVATFGIGSTNFRYTVGSTAGEFLTDVSVRRTDPARLEDQVRDGVADLREQVDGPLDAVSVSVTGLVDADRGVIREINTDDGSTARDVHLGEVVDDAFGLPVFVENDCNASAIAEYVFGAGVRGGHDSLIYVTFGTGVGAGVVDNGRLLRGANGRSAEVGPMTVNAEGDLSCFGIPGAWEAYCSGRGIPTFVEAMLVEESRETALREHDPLTAEDVFRIADDGDAVAEEYLDRVAQYNAAGIGTLVNVCDPSLVTLGGGVALNNRERILDGIRDHLETYTLVDPPELRITELGDYVGLYGALGKYAFTERTNGVRLDSAVSRSERASQ